VILGPSGAGKTTTLKSVAGLVDDVEGEVSIAGRAMTGVEPYERNVAMAFESYALYRRRPSSRTWPRRCAPAAPAPGAPPSRPSGSGR